MKRIISFIIAIVAVLMCLAMISCAKGNSGSKRPDDVINGDKRWADDIPEDVTLEGQTVTFVGYTSSGAFEPALTGTYVEEDTGEIVDTALYESVSDIKARFAVELEFIDASDYLTNAIINQLMAGDSDYDILAAYAFYDITLAADGYVLDLNNDLAEYGADNIIDTSKPYWSQNFIDSIAIGNSTYWLVGDISTLTLGCMYVTYVNADMYEKNCLEKYGSIYDIVKDGNWNLDKMSEMAALGYRDNNGNDKADSGDVFGWATCWVDVVDGMSISAGFEYSRKQVDGSISLTVNTNPHNINVINRLARLKTESFSYLSANDQEAMAQFASDQTFFTVNDLRLAEMYLRQMDTDYYILPTPKFNDKQAEYRTCVHDEYPLFGISYATDVPYAAAVVLEALCAEHSQSVRPKYYDEALKYKYTRDDGSADMIDIVRDSVFTDFVFSWSHSIGDITHKMRPLPASAASTFAKSEESWRKAFDNLIVDLTTEG